MITEGENSLEKIADFKAKTNTNKHLEKEELSYKDYNHFKAYIQYAFDKADVVLPNNAQVFIAHGNNKKDIPVEKLVLSEFYLLKLIDLINPSFNYWDNLPQIKSICDDWTAHNTNDCRFTVEQMRIKHIMFSQNSLIRFMYFVKENIKIEHD